MDALQPAAAPVLRLPEGKSKGLHVLNWAIGILLFLCIGLPLLGFAVAAIGDCNGGFSQEITCSVGFLTAPARFLGFLAVLLLLGGGVLAGGLLIIVLSIIAFALEVRHARRAGRSFASAIASVSFIALLLTVLSVLYLFVFA